MEFRPEILSSISLFLWIRSLTDIFSFFFAPVVLRRSQVQKTFYIDLRASAEPAGRCQRPRYVWMSRWGLYWRPGSPELRWAVRGSVQQSLAQGLIYKLGIASSTGGHSVLEITVGDSGTSRVCNQRDGGSWYPFAGGCYCRVYQACSESSVPGTRWFWGQQ